MNDMKLKVWKLTFRGRVESYITGNDIIRNQTQRMAVGDAGTGFVGGRPTF